DYFCSVGDTTLSTVLF
nr:immunoglobulin light chain junction region [Macaca mulatta]MOX69669.1 immunoglobulin light chain junction region [Macaca mulatta]MOX69694.1 immunoglobulin light chain junction region [Macaca mulatta]MOX69824.1 immunoglobulin light chain junction region [Macaca mulatta]MOX70262.1 immunoglobulin light chain junction region [Macaca mulatta]